MSTGPFLTGVAAAVVLSMAALSAAPSDDHKESKGRHGSQVAGSTYSAAFASGPACAAGGSARATSQVLHNNPFASALHGSSAYSAMFFSSGAGGGVSLGGSKAGASSAGGASLVSMPSNGRPSNGTVGTVTLPSLGLSRAPMAAVASSSAVTAQAVASSAATSASPAATPEPATLILLTTGLGGFYAARRRRSRR